ncbi:uncharacterized protein LOC131249030 [Magnolia sinica]|uniref:uncharacterized protein LOC131249030 n=1 Tax=Magnolia sinica TaxID=86752 RepID=UPI00265A5CAC|nr:uncharacterized protein LOC131249030 [Magnolia sinica]
MCSKEVKRTCSNRQLLVSYLSDCKYVLQIRDLETEYLHFWNLTARHRCNLATELPEMKIFYEIVISGFDRIEFQVNQIYSSPNEPYMFFKDTCNSSQTVVPTIASAVVGDRRISLGPRAGCAGLARQLELGYRQACLAASRPELPIEVAGPAMHNSNGECW